jgi:Uma2 family endonuclease
VFDSSAGFRLPDGSVFRPAERRGFAPLCPDLVVELTSSGVAAGFSEGVEGPRGVTALRRKMAAYQANGARLGWLLLPEQRTVEVWPATGVPTQLEHVETLEAVAEFPGLRLDLAEIWAG